MLSTASVVHAQRAMSVRSTLPAFSLSSKSVSSAAALSVGVPEAALKSANISELPYCGTSKTDSIMLWDKAAKQWTCRALTTLLPPKCDGADQALRFDGTAWKCETIGGLLVAHTATFDDLKGKNTCDTKNTWGGATCAVTSNGMGATLKCPPNTIQVDTNALNSYELLPHGSVGIDKFGGEYHAFCYSRPIKVAQ